MQTNLLGIIEEAGARPSWVPPNAGTTVQVPQYGSATLRLRVVRSTGAHVNVADWDAPQLAVRQMLGQQVYFTLTGVANPRAGQGVWDFTLAPSDTSRMQVGRFFFDVWLHKTVDGVQTNRQQVIPASGFYLLPSIVRPS